MIRRYGSGCRLTLSISARVGAALTFACLGLGATQAEPYVTDPALPQPAALAQATLPGTTLPGTVLSGSGSAQPAAVQPAAKGVYGPPSPFGSDPAAAKTDEARATSALPHTPLRAKIEAFPARGTAQEIKERAVVSDFYAARADAPLWVSQKGLTEKGAAVVAEIMKAGDWGLDAAEFKLPQVPNAAVADLSADDVAEAELAISLAILKYARFARGGRIIDPTLLLSSQLDRKPQLLDPERVFSEIAAADAPDAYLRGVHPKQPQFEKLRQQYLATRNKALAERIRANMEEWRWMPDDLGEVHILANVPEFMVYLYKGDKPIHTERIVVGELGKQTTIFSRNLKTVVFNPMWRVPESIKVRELLPNLRRGGSLFRQWDLELQTKDGQALDYRTIDWGNTDIRNYEVVQPPGRKNVMGVVKFTFPSQHTIFMHDTVDKWMFAQSVRTLSHGCMRLRNPMKMAEMVLAEDKGWDAQKVDAEQRDGGRNREIVIEKKIPVHLVYFTTWVDDDGKLRTFNDIYGHEKRIRLALAGKWDEIDIGKDHLAPVEPGDAGAMATSSTRPGAPRYARTKQPPTVVDIIGDALGGGF
jgi:murein L,D-transpeptidase YcbB/YkuD